MMRIDLQKDSACQVVGCANPTVNWCVMVMIRGSDSPFFVVGFCTKHLKMVRKLKSLGEKDLITVKCREER